MIKRISKINNLAVFNNFDWNTSVVNKDGQAINFAKINILYGRNYSGKTTLSRIIRSLETKKRLDKYDDHHYEICNEDGTTITEQSLDSNTLDIRVFNEDFIRENLHFLIDPNSGITPFAILGSDNDRIQREIDMLTDEIGTPEGKTGLYKVLSDQKNQYNICIEEYNSVKNALDKKLASKATDRSSGIKYQSAKYGDQNYNVTKLKDEISIVASGKYSCLKPEKKSELELLLAQSPKNAIKLIETPSLNLDIYCKNAEELMTKKIEVSNKIQELLVNNALNEWVKRGTELFDGEDVCPFCGNRISDERWKEIHAHFDEETKKLTSDLEQLIRQIEIEIETVSKPLSISQEDFYPTFSADYLTATEQKDNAVKLYCKALGDVVIQLNSRIKQITQPLQFERVVYDVAQINDAFQAINNVIKKNNEYTEYLEIEQKHAKVNLRLQEVYDFCQIIDYNKQTEEIRKLEEKRDILLMEMKETSELIANKENELSAKKRALNNEEEGAKRVNSYLNDFFGHHFVSLEAEQCEGEQRIKFHIKRDGKPAYNLSEGECSLIAFCYFIAKLDDVDTEGKKPIIWIDDPISSLDGNHIYFLYSLLVTKIAKRGQFDQLFVSTHNMDFLKYLRRLKAFKLDESGRSTALSKQYFLVERIGEQSSIKKMPLYLEKNATEFNYLFSIIYKCANTLMITDENYDLLCSFGNNARKFLEMYLFFKYPDDQELHSKLKKFFAPDDVPPILIERLLNEDSHGGAPERLSETDINPETIPVANKIIELISKDDDQYKALLRSIGETT